MKTFLFISIICLLLPALFALVSCSSRDCVHTNCTVTVIGNGQHSVVCNDCDYAITENCTGGTANCYSGPLCSKCGAEYGEPDANAHMWANGKCTVTGCEATCDHTGHLAVTNLSRGQHKYSCNVCDYEITESCTGGTANCYSGPLCSKCGAEYGSADESLHNWQNGTCSVTGCGKACDHTGHLSATNLSRGQHKLECDACDYELTEGCSGGSATTEAYALCDKCHTAYGDLVPEASGNYKYVVVIGLDGAGTFFRNTSTPNIDRIFANGAITYNMLTSNPTISAQCWGSMLHGVTPEFHKLTNGIVEGTRYDPKSPFPSFFRVIRENDPDAVLASFSHWSPINYGIVEEGLGVYKDNAKKDLELTSKICTYLASNTPNVMFVQFDDTDAAGHNYGYGGAEHLETITRLDGYIGQIYNTYVEKDIIDDTLFIVTADHGGINKSHGGWSDSEKYIMFAVAGKTVKKGGTIQDAEVRDTAAVVLHAFGYRQPEAWTARVPGDLFVGVDAKPRPVYVDKNSERYHETQPTPEKGSGKHVTDFVAHNLSLYLPFDGDTTDQCGSTTSTSGKLYFIKDGYYGSAVQLDDGYITLNDYALEDKSFTLAFWIQTQGSEGSPLILSNSKDWSNGKSTGLSVSLVGGTTNAMKFNVGNGSANSAAESMPSDFKQGWTHVTISVDRENNQVIFYYDFGAPDIKPLNVGSLTFQNTAAFNIGQDASGKYKYSLTATLDEFMIFDGVFSLEDNAALAKYFGKDPNGSDFHVDTHEPIETPAKDSEHYITNFITDKNLSAYLTFDDTVADSTGKKNTGANGSITYENGVFGKGVVLNSGYVSIHQYAPGKNSFTLSFFIKTDGTTGDPGIVSNKDWKSGRNSGFVLALKPKGLLFNAGNGSRMDKTYKLPYDYREAWTHIVLVVDRENNLVKLSTNFGDFVEVEIPADLRGSSFDAYSVLNLGQDGTGTYGSKFIGSMDEFMMFDGAFTDADLQQLAKYYSRISLPMLDGAENTDIKDDDSAVSAGAVVRLGINKYYTTVQAAIDAASINKINTLTLLKDITINSEIAFNNELTIVGNGHTVTANAAVVLGNGAALTLKNVSLPTDKIVGVGAMLESNNVTTYYATLQNAIDMANAGSGGTITLLADADYGKTAKTYPISKNITIDGQGRYKIIAKLTIDLYSVAEGVTFTVRNLTMTVETVSGTNQSIIYLGTVQKAKAVIENCTITSTNDVALQATRRSGGGFTVKNSTIYGGNIAIRYNNSDHALNIINSTVEGGTYSILTIDGSSMDATVTNSTLISNIKLTGTAWVILEGNTTLNVSSGYAVQLTTASNSLTLKDTAKINGTVKVDAGSVNFDASYIGTQIIRKSGSDYYFFDEVADAFANAIGSYLVYTYSQETAESLEAEGYGIEPVQEVGKVIYYKVLPQDNV